MLPVKRSFNLQKVIHNALSARSSKSDGSHARYVAAISVLNCLWVTLQAPTSNLKKLMLASDRLSHDLPNGYASILSGAPCGWRWNCSQRPSTGSVAAKLILLVRWERNGRGKNSNFSCPSHGGDQVARPFFAKLQCIEGEVM